MVERDTVICQLSLIMVERDIKNGRISTPRDLDFDLGSGDMAYRRASLINLNLKIVDNSACM